MKYYAIIAAWIVLFIVVVALKARLLLYTFNILSMLALVIFFGYSFYQLFKKGPNNETEPKTENKEK